MRLKWKKFCSVILVVLMLFTFSVPVYALSNQEVSHSITFTNKPIESKGLIVSKNVENLSAEQSDIGFTFVLTVNNKQVKNEKYVLYDAGGKEIKRYYDRDSQTFYDMTEAEYLAANVQWFEVDRKTDETGYFVLKAKQTAVFTELNVMDRFEVQEVEIPDGFQQVVPVNGAAATGIIYEDGTEARFVNKYVPPNVPELPTISKTLTVKKSVQDITGYASYDKNTTFTFVINVAGEPWANQTYDLIDYTTGAYVTNAGSTDEAGCFQLKPEQSAVFSGLPAFARYTVEEESVPNWWSVTESKQNGITTGDAVVEFINRSASFAVKKTMKDDSAPDESFTFVLTDQDDKPMVGVEYHICGEDGKQIMDSVRTTDQFGQFMLQAKQTAVFVGVEPDVVFNVKELSQTGFEQVTPSTGEGYRNQIVQEGQPEVLLFTNDYRTTEEGLTVSKTVICEQNMQVEDVAYIFRLLDYRNRPVGEEKYQIGDKTFTTDTNGYFTLKSGETAKFERLDSIRKYTVQELGIRSTDDEGNDIFVMEQFAPREGAEQTSGTFGNNRDLVFTNVYESYIDLSILKVDADDGERVLEGATFLIEKVDENGDILSSFTPVQVTTGADGTVVVPKVSSGTYCIKEIQAPAGYNSLQAPIIVRVSTSENRITYHTQIVEIQNGAAEVVIENEGGYELPESGGTGSKLFTIGGILMVGCGLLYGLFFRQRRRYR